MRRAAAFMLASGLAVSSVGTFAAPVAGDPDWPCRQRLVPELTAATFWNGPPLPADLGPTPDPRIAAAIAAAASRDVPVEQAVAALDRLADPLKPTERAALLPAIFTGLVADTNRQRGDIIGRIKELTRRQRAIGDRIAEISAELHDLAAASEGDGARRRDEIVERRNFAIRSFEETERTMRYACEVPVELEARLGRFARALEAHL
jgi:hypothetical protein